MRRCIIVRKSCLPVAICKAIYPNELNSIFLPKSPERDPMLFDILAFRSASVRDQAGASPHLQAVTHSLYTGLWWQVKGHTTPARPRRGFCPGTGCADLAFTLVFRLYISSLQDRLRAEGIGLTLRCPNSDFPSIAGGVLVENLAVTWVDDTVVLCSLFRTRPRHSTC